MKKLCSAHSMRRLRLIILSLSMIAGIWSPTAAHALTSGCFTYTVSASSARITDASACSGAVVVPSTLDGYSVTSIGSFAFFEDSAITSVTLPDSVISLSSYSFHYMPELTYLNLGNGVTTLGSYNVAYSPKLSTVVLGSGFRKLGTYSMTGNTSLKTLNLPDGSTTIDTYAFSNSSVETVTIPATVITANIYAFASSPLVNVTYAGNSGPVLSRLIDAFGNCGWTGPAACINGPAFTLSKTAVEASTRATVSSYSITTTRGAGTTYSINPTIGNGLSFNTSTGLISGRPIADAGSITYAITATNASGSATATFSITVISNVLTFNCSPFMSASINVRRGDLLIYSRCPSGSITSINNSVISSSTSDGDFGSPTFTLQISNTVPLGSYLRAFTLSTFGRSTEFNLTVETDAPTATIPDAPTIGLATALSPTSASISFTAPASNGGATIETYTATSTPGSITGRVLQSGSGSITVTGLTPSTAYTFRVTASNSAGTSSASGATVSITMPASQSEIDAAALAAQKAAEAKREVEKLAALAEISNYLKDSKVVSLGMFTKAEIVGVTEATIEAVQAEISAFPQSSRPDLSQVLKITRKYEVVGKIASNQCASVHSDSYIEIGLIPEGSKQKAALTAAIQKLPPSDRSSYASIQKAINAEMAEIQARKDRLANVIARNASRYRK